MDSVSFTHLKHIVYFTFVFGFWRIRKQNVHTNKFYLRRGCLFACNNYWIAEWVFVKVKIYKIFCDFWSFRNGVIKDLGLQAYDCVAG
jgi:hypothetical protein